MITIRRNQSAAARRRAFSLAELMIALMILGLGLLFIASALPAGLDYTKTTVDLSTADAAADYALDTLEANLRLAGDQIMDPRVFEVQGALPAELGLRQSTVFQPRLINTDATAVQPVDNVYEPFLKVRPVVMGNLQLISDASAVGEEIVDDGEATIRGYLFGPEFLGSGLLQSSLVLGIGTEITLEADYGPAQELVLPFARKVSLRFNPAVPALGRVYPPVEPLTQYRATSFFANDADYPTYLPRLGLGNLGTASVAEQQRERLKARDRRVGWTAFYRRVAYGSPGIGDDPYSNLGGGFPPAGTPEKLVLGDYLGAPGLPDDEERFGSNLDPASGNPNAVRARIAGEDDELTDPELYELIVVITARPSEQHRYARQFVGGGMNSFSAPSAVAPGASNAVEGRARLLPTPWLVVFESLPIPRNSGSLLAYNYRTNLSSRYLGNDAVGLTDRGPLEFRCSPEVGRLLPVGSVIIPAANDHYPHHTTVIGNPANPLAGQLINYPVPRRVGFVPHAPDTLPIYRVIDRPDPQTVVVENNGFAPWIAPEIESASPVANTNHLFPMWVIPPPYVELDSSGQPVFEGDNHILAVERRIVRLKTIADVE